MNDAELNKLCTCIDELSGVIDRQIQKTEENKKLRVGASVIHKRWRQCGRVISYNPETGVVVVQQGPGGWTAMEYEVEVQE